MASNYSYVKKYEENQKLKGLTRQRAWIPNTQTDKQAFLDFADKLRANYLSSQNNGISKGSNDYDEI